MTAPRQLRAHNGAMLPAVAPYNLPGPVASQLLEVPVPNTMNHCGLLGRRHTALQNRHNMCPSHSCPHSVNTAWPSSRSRATDVWRHLHLLCQGHAAATNTNGASRRQTPTSTPPGWRRDPCWILGMRAVRKQKCRHAPCCGMCSMLASLPQSNVSRTAERGHHYRHGRGALTSEGTVAYSRNMPHAYTNSSNGACA